MNDAGGSISVKVLFFGAARDAAGVSEARLCVAPAASVETVKESVFVNFPRMPAVKKGLMIAVNEEYARPDTAVSDGDVVAFLPPVSGG